ncbi:MAG: DapH/DapD/GlmU-related protein [Methanoregulaceae archaeon]
MLIGIRLKWCIKKGFPLRLALCDIDIKNIPSRTRFAHPYGIAIAVKTIIGEHCDIRQNVTIGNRKFKFTSEQVPIIGNHVFIGAGSIILGPVTIGDNAVIGAGAIVVEDVPANTVYITKRN